MKTNNELEDYLRGYSDQQLANELERRKSVREAARKAAEKDHVCTQCRGTGYIEQRCPMSGVNSEARCYGCNGTGTVRF